MKYIQLFLSLVCAAHVLAAESKIIAPGATLQKLAGGFAFTEGPACDGEGNVFFTDQPNDRILKWSVEGKLSTFMQPCGRANGLCFDHEDYLWACADEKNELWRIDPAGKATVVVKDYQGKLLNGPNDVWVRPNHMAVMETSSAAPKAAKNALPGERRAVGPGASPPVRALDLQEVPGGLYFTDPYYQRPYWKRGPKEMAECVYFLAPDYKTLTRVIDDMKQPNGIIGTPDGKLLYVGDIGAGKTYRYRIQPDGSLKEKTLFCEMGSDGMTIDSEGNIYLTGKGVSVFDAAGKKIEHIEVAEAWTGNVCFGGKDRQTLFITASKGLYALRMNVHGVGSQ
ncbi:MAG: SMP-30/gluconolactonase/LRE family protein [Verrucomicrobiota bacterium]